LLDEPQRLLAVADEPRDRGAQPQRLGLEQHVLGFARVLQRRRGGAKGGGRLADIDVELRERAVRLCELARVADAASLRIACTRSCCGRLASAQDPRAADVRVNRRS
jgi:hypothetical protein